MTPQLKVLWGAKKPSDRDLDDAHLRAFFAGDETAFAELVRSHDRAVFALVRRYTRDLDEARELTQRAFVRAFEAARRASQPWRSSRSVPFQAWLLRIAINIGKNYARDARRRPQAPAIVLEELPASTPSALEMLERREREQLARAAVLELPRRQREVLTLRVDAALSFSEIGRVLDVTENNAKVHFHHAVKRLRTLLVPKEAK